MRGLGEKNTEQAARRTGELEGLVIPVTSALDYLFVKLIFLNKGKQ